MKRLLLDRVIAAAVVMTVSFPAVAELSDRYVIDIYKPDKVMPGTTVFRDATDPNHPKIVEVDMRGKVVWSYDIPSSFGGDGGTDVEWIPSSDHILFTRLTGVYEVDRKKNIVWSYQAPASHDADRLANGNTLFVWGWGADSTVPEVREVDPGGRIVWQWHAAEHLKGEKRIIDREGYTHANSVVRLENGDTLVSLRNFYMLVEVDRSGKIVWKLPGLFTTPHDPEILANGNILVNTRGPEVIKEITPAGQVVWQYEPDQRDVQLVRYNHRLPNGNTIFVERTKIIEISPEREIVWQLRLKDVGTDPSDNSSWLYKAERIPADRRAFVRHAYAAPSETLARSGQATLSPDQQIAEQAHRRARGMMRRMDADGDGRIARAEFAARAPFEDFDMDHDGYVTLDEAAAFHTKRLMRRAAGERGGGRQR